MQTHTHTHQCDDNEMLCRLFKRKELMLLVRLIIVGKHTQCNILGDEDSARHKEDDDDGNVVDNKIESIVSTI